MGVWKKLTPTLMDDFGGFKTSVEDVSADVVEAASESELEVKPEAVMELLWPRDNTLMAGDLLPMGEQRNRLLR